MFNVAGVIVFAVALQAGVASPPADEDVAVLGFVVWANDQGTTVQSPSCTIAASGAAATCYGRLADGSVLVAEGTAVEGGTAYVWHDVTALPPVVVPQPVSQAGEVGVAELNAALADPVQAWLDDPNDLTQAAVRAAAQSLLDSGRPLAPDTVDSTVERDPREVLEAVADGMSFWISDGAAILNLEDLALTSVDLPFVLRHGTFLVNEEVPPGTYRQRDVRVACSWEILDEAGNFIDGNFVTAAPQVLMTVSQTDYAVTNDCGFMVLITDAT